LSRRSAWAREALVNALQLQPNMAGVKKLCTALDVEHPAQESAPTEAAGAR
jgi:hypothetical protein